MNYFEYIEQRSKEIQALLDKRGMAFCRVNDTIIKTKPFSRVTEHDYMSAKDVVLAVIEGEQRYQLYFHQYQKPGVLSEMARMAPYFISINMIGSELVNGFGAALAISIPIGLTFALTRVITRQLDKADDTIRREREVHLREIMSYDAEGSKKALQQRVFEGLVAFKVTETIDTIEYGLQRSGQLILPQAKLKLTPKRTNAALG